MFSWTEVTKKANCNGQILVFCLYSLGKEITGKICNKGSRKVHVCISAAPLHEFPLLKMGAACSKWWWNSSSNHLEKYVKVTKEMLVSESGASYMFSSRITSSSFFFFFFGANSWKCAHTLHTLPCVCSLPVWLWNTRLVVDRWQLCAYISCGRGETICSESLMPSAVFT